MHVNVQLLKAFPYSRSEGLHVLTIICDLFLLPVPAPRFCPHPSLLSPSLPPVFYSIMGLYASVVLVIGKFVREFFSGISHSIMFEELPCVDRILKLCTDIFLVTSRTHRLRPLMSSVSCDVIFPGEGNGRAGAGGGALRQADLLV